VKKNYLNKNWWNCDHLETERVSREKTEAELCELKQNSAPATTLSEKLTPDATTILSQLRVRRKKSPVSLADIKAILEILDKLTPLGEIRNYAPLKRGFIRHKNLQTALDKDLKCCNCK
jgi:hypothetical protein